MRQLLCQKAPPSDDIHPFTNMPPSTEYAPVTAFSASGAPRQTIFFIVVAKSYDSANGPFDNGVSDCQQHFPQHDFASGPVFSALFGPTTPAGEVSDSSLPNAGFVPAQWWWQNFTGRCWSFDVSDKKPQQPCAPNPNTWTQAAAWTH